MTRVSESMLENSIFTLCMVELHTSDLYRKIPNILFCPKIFFFFYVLNKKSTNQFPSLSSLCFFSFHDTGALLSLDLLSFVRSLGFGSQDQFIFAIQTG